MNDQDSMKILGVLRAHFSNPLTPAHLHELFDEFVRNFNENIYRSRTPIYTNFTLGTQPWVVDYKGRKHVFVFNTSGTAVNLVSGSFTIPLPPQSWTPIGHDQGTSFNGSAATMIIVKCTDEVAV